jgi:hypothetical protein
LIQEFTQITFENISENTNCRAVSALNESSDFVAVLPCFAHFLQNGTFHPLAGAIVITLELCALSFRNRFKISKLLLPAVQKRAKAMIGIAPLRPGAVKSETVS